MDMKERLQDAVDACADRMKNHQQLSKALGLSVTATYHWHKIPDKRVIAVAKLTAIPLTRLRPDLYEDIEEILHEDGEPLY